MALLEPKTGPGDRPESAGGCRRDPDDLLAAWRHLLRTHHHLHAPEAARMLGVPEAALTASRIGSGAVRLIPDVAAVLAPASAWGRVLCAVSNPCGVHMPLGEVAAEANGDGVVCLQGAHMRAEIDAGAAADAYLFVDWDESHGNTRSVQFYDAAGAAILKLFIFHKTKFDAAEGHFAGLKAGNQSRRPSFGLPAASRFDARAASLAEDPVAALLDATDVKPLLAALLGAALPAEGGSFAIEMVGDHARVVWRGLLSGARLDKEMLHLHESDLRSHLRYAPLLRAARTRSDALALDGEDGRLLRIAKEGGR